MTVTGAEATRDRRWRLRAVPGAWYIVNYMVQYASAHLDASLAALSDSTRRGVLESYLEDLLMANWRLIDWGRRLEIVD
jgi:hypothetical protein